MRRWRSKSGVNMLWAHYTDDPEKRSAEWKAKTSMGVDPDKWAMEMEGDETVRSGTPVFLNYDDMLHNPMAFRDKPFPVMDGSWWVAGWDAGITVHPAFVLGQVVPTTGQILVMGEVDGFDGETADMFVPRVADWILQHYPYEFHIDHGGDPSIRTHSGLRRGDTASKILRASGFVVKPQSNVWQVRKSNVSWALGGIIKEEVLPHPEILGKQIIRKHPRMVINGKMCPMLIEGFRGSYKLPAIPESIDPNSTDAVQKPLPLKNRWSHVHDSLQYMIAVARKLLNDSSLTSYSYAGAE